MKKWLTTCLCMTAIAAALKVEGHGIPITVTVDGNNKLVTQNLQPLYEPADLTSGYAATIFLDADSEAVMDHIQINSPPLQLQGGYAFTTLPGFDVTGMAPNSELNLEVVPRPVKGSNPVAQRLLWHWSQLQASQNHDPVVVDPNGESLIIASDPDGSVLKISVPQTDGPALKIKVADPTADELGVHQHYLQYLLGDSPAADLGAYGFFARLTSPNYASSDPFLVILNNGIFDDENPGQLPEAALAINRAALLAGDFNHDDRVDAADYTVWRDTLGSTTQLAADTSGNHIVDADDFLAWKNNFGVAGGAGGNTDSPLGNVVAEPGSGFLALCAMLALLPITAVRRRRRA